MKKIEAYEGLTGAVYKSLEEARAADQKYITEKIADDLFKMFKENENEADMRGNFSKVFAYRRNLVMEIFQKWEAKAGINAEPSE